MENDYYDETKKKVIDFFIGFGGAWLIGALLVFITYLLDGVMDIVPDWFVWMMLVLLILLNALAVYLGFKNSRRFISIGIIATSLVPLLIFGACIGFVVMTITY